MNHQSRQSLFKKAVSSDDGREKRSNISFKIRREKNEMKLNKKRNILDQQNIVPQINEETLNVCCILAKDAVSEDRNVRFRAIQGIRQKLSIQNRPPIDEVIQSGLVPILVRDLQFHEDPEIQLEAAWALTNIASGNTLQTCVIIESGAIPNFIALLRSPKPQVREQSIWAIGNIAGDNVRFRDILLNAGVLTPLLEQFKETNPAISLIKNAAWTLSNLCRGKPQPDPKIIQPALEIFGLLLKQKDKDIISDIAWALSYLSDGDKDEIQRVMDIPGVVQRLIELLSHENFLVISPALRAVGNFISGSDQQTWIALEYGALDKLVRLLDHSKLTIVNETVWTLSNIAAGNQQQVSLLLGTGAMTTIIQLMTNAPFEIQKEAAWCVYNLTSNLKYDIINYLVSIDVIPALLELLKITDIELKEVTLKSLENILKVGKQVQMLQSLQDNPYSLKIIEHNGCDTITDLQDHNDDFISARVRTMIKEYFNYEEENDTEGNEKNEAFTGFN